MPSFKDLGHLNLINMFSDASSEWFFYLFLLKNKDFHIWLYDLEKNPLIPVLVILRLTLFVKKPSNWKECANVNLSLRFYLFSKKIIYIWIINMLNSVVQSSNTSALARTKLHNSLWNGSERNTCSYWQSLYGLYDSSNTNQIPENMFNFHCLSIILK